MKPSPEVKETMLRAYGTETSRNLDEQMRHFSRQEGLLVIGTDPDEWWQGHELVARIHTTQLAEMGGKAWVEPGDLQAYAEGTVGWAADRATLHAMGQDIPVRITAVLHREDDGWKVVQQHVSIGVANAEALGKELTT